MKIPARGTFPNTGAANGELSNPRRARYPRDTTKTGSTLTTRRTTEIIRVVATAPLGEAMS